MMARLSVGSVEPWEVVLSIGLLVVTVPIVTLALDPGLPRRRAAVRAAADDADLRARRSAG